MAFISFSSDPIQRAAEHLRPRVKFVVGAGILFLMSAWILPGDVYKLILLIVAGTLGFVALWIRTMSRVEQKVDVQSINAAETLIGEDSVPCILTGSNGAIIYKNMAVDKFCSMPETTTLAGLLNQTMANPGTILFRMESRSKVTGSAHEDVVTREGHVRLSVNRAGEDRF